MVRVCVRVRVVFLKKRIPSVMFLETYSISDGKGDKNSRENVFPGALSPEDRL